MNVNAYPESHLYRLATSEEDPAKSIGPVAHAKALIGFEIDLHRTQKA